LAQSKKQDRQRRLIDVPQIEMARTGDVIKLIAKITVAPVCQQMDEQATALKKAINADSVKCVRLDGDLSHA